MRYRHNQSPHFFPISLTATDQGRWRELHPHPPILAQVSTTPANRELHQGRSFALELQQAGTSLESGWSTAAPSPSRWELEPPLSPKFQAWITFLSPFSCPRTPPLPPAITGARCHQGTTAALVESRHSVPTVSPRPQNLAWRTPFPPFILKLWAALLLGCRPAVRRRATAPTMDVATAPYAPARPSTMAWAGKAARLVGQLVAVGYAPSWDLGPESAHRLFNILFIFNPFLNWGSR
jgi:hypothetical protein